MKLFGRYRSVKSYRDKNGKYRKKPSKIEMVFKIILSIYDMTQKFKRRR